MDLNCVAETIYYEARGEGETGMRAVAHVIYNRAKKSGQRPCTVVNKPNQFATRKGRKIRNKRLWDKALIIARNPGRDITNGATYFHNYSVRPGWSYHKKITYRWKNHIFYK